MQSLELRNDFLQVTEKDYCMVIDKYNMTDRMVQESMESIRQWYRVQPHLPSADDRLFRHLLAVGFSIEKAKTKIDNMMTARTMMPEVMQNRDPYAEWAQRTREYVRVALLPQLHREDMTRVLAIDFTDKEAVGFSFVDLVKMFNVLCDYRLCADISLGEHYVTDFSTVKVGHMMTMTPSLIKKALFLMQSCFGAKIKGIHYVNVPSFAEYAIAVVKAGMSKKISERIHVYKDHESLHKVFPKSMLPKEMGGDEKSMDEFAEDLRTELCKPEWRDWFKQQDEVKTEESKQIGVISDMSNQLLGIQGSFRKPNAD